jgi:uncharacterized protein YjiS (DUF1127 family)
MPNGHSFQMTGHIVQTNNESFRTDGPDARGTGELAQTLSDEARQSKSPFVIPAAAEAERSHAHARPGGCEWSSSEYENGDQAAPVDARASLALHWLISLLKKIVSIQRHWRREHEIRKAVAALSQFDDRTLRDIGIHGRSEIEQVVRYCRDC